MGGILVRSIPRASDFHHDAIHAIHAIVLSLAIVCIGASAVISLRTLAPRLRSLGEPDSMIYFDHIARRYGSDKELYIRRFVRLSAKDNLVAEQVVEQIWANSCVARRKFQHVALAIYLLGAGMILSGLAVLVQRL
ncbi:hypothetical protein Asera_37780 [Actinocatenispora sera]|uniref:Pycsar effector protein domain-containing protein n=1 Tax=Actinocatenispora sera TaxID=390989 RepID=A0A810L2Y6_9ACTN|nr:hypothetical protein Asera_36950 [Actinocatenispora sera]BCJ29630.1 hypothetical protein Asera_37380 [Actinocatenispora sera]BCJ29650.1 hypothetical protein Asera_37580 [Actinocatenispora sera]BCJ29670.1 hypothetical protein Asera_37780 [Actinocatenispora sera]